MQLVLSHIDYTYPTSPEPVLSDVSLTFPQGWIGIVGDNGSGKTTLARRKANSEKRRIEQEAQRRREEAHRGPARRTAAGFP